MIETLNANISGLNASLLNAAELVTTQYAPTDRDESQEKKTSSLMDDIIVGREEIEKRREQKKQGIENKNQNEIINNMLSYFKERFEGNE